MSKKKARVLNTKHVVTIAAVTVVILVAIGSVIVWIQMNQSTEPTVISDEQKATVEANVKQSKKDGKLREEATESISNDDVSNAQKLYQDAVDAEKTAERKTLLYIDLSGILFAAGRYDEAFAIMEKADIVNDDKYLIADWLSRLYESRKNYAKAAEYYRLAAEWATSSQNKTGIDKEEYEAEAVRVAKLIGTETESDD